MLQITHDPRAVATPSQLRAADERLARLARIEGRAVEQPSQPRHPVPLFMPANVPLRPIVSHSTILGTPLHARSTFANLIPYRGAALAQAAARQLCDVRDAGLTVSPLFVHSRTGLGKTHLLQSIAAEYATGGISVAHYDAGTLSRLFMRATSLADILECDALIIDDLEMIQGHRNKQQLSALLGSFAAFEKPTVVSASIRPGDLEGFEDRTISRLNGGLAVEIFAPDRDARLAFILQRIERLQRAGRKFDLTDIVTCFIADRLAGSFRDLEAAMNRLLALQRSGEEITTDICAATVFDLTKPEEYRAPKIEDIQRACCKHYGIDRNDILSSRRTAVIVRPRQVAMYLAKILTLRSLPEIGRRFGGRDHTTVLHAVRKITALVASDSSLAVEVAAIASIFQPQAAT